MLIFCINGNQFREDNGVLIKNGERVLKSREEKLKYYCMIFPYKWNILELFKSWVNYENPDGIIKSDPDQVIIYFIIIV